MGKLQENLPVCTVVSMTKQTDSERVQRMAQAGYSLREIGEAVGVSHTQVARILASEPAPQLAPVTIKARDGMVVIETDSPQVVGVAVMRALRRAGIKVQT